MQFDRMSKDGLTISRKDIQDTFQLNNTFGEIVINAFDNKKKLTRKFFIRRFKELIKELY